MTCVGAASARPGRPARKGRVVGRTGAALACLVALSLSACGPVPLAQAERQCAARMNGVSNKPVRGSALMGINQDGKAIHDIDVNVSLTTRMGQDPDALYQRCVYDRSGEFPSQPLTSRQN